MALRSVGRWDDALRTMDEAGPVRGARTGRGHRSVGLGDGTSWCGVLGWSKGQVGQRTLAALGNTVSADKARLLSALGWALSASGDYPAATATFDQARTC